MYIICSSLWKQGYHKQHVEYFGKDGHWAIQNNKQKNWVCSAQSYSLIGSTPQTAVQKLEDSLKKLYIMAWH